MENGGLALVSFASLVVYAQFLGPAEFGLFSIVLALVELLDVLVSMLFHDALVQRPAVTERHFDTAFTASMLLALALLAGCWLLAPAFAHLVHHDQAAGVLTFTALRFPFTALGATIVARQRRELSFRVLALRSLVGRLGGAILGSAWWPWGRGSGAWWCSRWPSPRRRRWCCGSGPVPARALASGAGSCASCWASGCRRWGRCS